MRMWVILGCGYVGARLGDRLLAEGDSVTVTTRSRARGLELEARWDSSRATVAVLESAAVDAIAALIAPGSIVVNSIPPTDSGEDIENAIAAACADAGAARLIYLSSTGVYGRGDGGWIDEDTEVAPIGERGERRLAAEIAIREAAIGRGLEIVALRIAGIYGPNRGVQTRLQRGDYRIYGAGSSLVSRVHVDDLVRAIERAGQATRLPRAIYCIADDEPTSSRAHADGVAALMGVAPPPSVPMKEASASARAMLDANRRISNRRAVAELGWVLEYPSWRDGVAALVNP